MSQFGRMMRFSLAKQPKSLSDDRTGGKRQNTESILTTKGSLIIRHRNGYAHQGPLAQKLRIKLAPTSLGVWFTPTLGPSHLAALFVAGEAMMPLSADQGHALAMLSTAGRDGAAQALVRRTMASMQA